MTRSIAKKHSQLTISLTDKFGNERTPLDFTRLACSEPVAKGIRDTFELETSHLSFESRKQAWRCVLKFSSFMSDEKLSNAKKLPFDLLPRWRNWLDKQVLAGSTKQSILNLIIQLLNALVRHFPALAPEGLYLNFTGFSRQPPKKSKALTKEEMTLIVRASQKEISAVESRIHEGNIALSGSHPDATLVEILGKIMTMQGGRLTQQEMRKRGAKFMEKVERLGGIRHLHSLLYLTARDLLGFYILLVMQTSGNPMAIRELRRDCVRPHPLRSDLNQISWNKPRAGQEQKTDFPSQHRWAAPSLVARLRGLNDNLRAHAPPGLSDYLFLSRADGRVTLPIHQMLHILLDQMIVRHGLPNFDFKDLRGSGATLVFAESESLSVVQKKLNHINKSTTTGYIDQTVLQESQARTIRRFQGVLIELSLAHTETSAPKSVTQSQPAQTVFGFDCADPFAGVAPGSSRGTACDQFSQCATCPGAIVILDDVKVVAKLIATSKHLSQLGEWAIRQGWSKRFEFLYGATIRTINEELLPAVSISVRQAAEPISLNYRLPFLD